MSENSKPATLPFAGVRVLELGTVVAGPFCGSMLADLGAEVIKIEPPGAGDPHREMGYKKNGVPVWWGVDVREKRCTCLDLKDPAGKARFLDLAKTADVLIENYRVGVMARLGLDWPALSRLNPKLVMLTMTGFGSNGPKSSLPGFGKIAEGMSGMMPLVRSPVENSVFVGFSLADASTAMFGLFAIALALYERDVFDATGAHIDLALYEPLLRMLDCRLALQAANPSCAASVNDDHPYGWGSGEPLASSMHVVRCASGEWLAIYVPERSALDRVAGGASAAGSVKVRLSALAASRSARDVASLLGPAGIQVSPVFDGLSIFNDRYFQERGDVLAVETEIGTLGVPGPYPKDAGHIATMTRFRPAPLGADNAAVFPPERIG